LVVEASGVAKVEAAAQVAAALAVAAMEEETAEAEEAVRAAKERVAVEVEKGQATAVEEME